MCILKAIRLLFSLTYHPAVIQTTHYCIKHGEKSLKQKMKIYNSCGI